MMLEQLAKILVSERGKQITNSMPHLFAFFEGSFQGSIQRGTEKSGQRNQSQAN